MEILLTAALISLASGEEVWGPRPWEAYGRGIRWEKSLEEAKARAAREAKPILFYQLVGDLDKEGC